jgi:hypothetical protein
MYEVNSHFIMPFSIFRCSMNNRHAIWAHRHHKWQLPHVTWHCLVVRQGETWLLWSMLESGQISWMVIIWNNWTTGTYRNCKGAACSQLCCPHFTRWICCYHLPASLSTSSLQWSPTQMVATINTWFDILYGRLIPAQRVQQDQEKPVLSTTECYSPWASTFGCSCQIRKFMPQCVPVNSEV